MYAWPAYMGPAPTGPARLDIVLSDSCEAQIVIDVTDAATVSAPEPEAVPQASAPHTLSAPAAAPPDLPTPASAPSRKRTLSLRLSVDYDESSGRADLQLDFFEEEVAEEEPLAEDVERKLLLALSSLADGSRNWQPDRESRFSSKPDGFVFPDDPPPAPRKD